MVTFSSHILNSVNGTHSSLIPITINIIEKDGNRRIVCQGKTDDGGRFKENIKILENETNCEFEMIIFTKEYFFKEKIIGGSQQMFNKISVRFLMPNVNGVYHIPIIISPNGYSVWGSGE